MTNRDLKLEFSMIPEMNLNFSSQICVNNLKINRKLIHNFRKITLRFIIIGFRVSQNSTLNFI